MTLELVTFIKPRNLPNLHNNDVNIRVSNTKQHSEQLWLMHQRINMLFPCQTSHSILATYTFLSWRVHNLNEAITQDVPWKHRWWKWAIVVTLMTASHLPFFLFSPTYQHFTKQLKLTNDHTALSSKHFNKHNTALLPSNQLTTDALSHNGNQKVLIRGLLGLVKQNRTA
jgi:hypothetical protein